MLDKYGCKTLKASSTTEALEIIKTTKVDIIMPEMTGYDVLREVSEKHPGILVQLTGDYSAITNLKMDIKDINILCISLYEYSTH